MIVIVNEININVIILLLLLILLLLCNEASIIIINCYWFI